MYRFFCRFIRRLVYFFKPTNHQFSRIESSNELEKKYAIVGCQLVDFLLRCEQVHDYMFTVIFC